MPYDEVELNKSWMRKNAKTIIMVAFLLALAGFFRVAFNYEPAVNDGDYRFAGNDDYYHLRVVQHVQTEGEHLVLDPLLNYPIPGTINPRPPLYNWHVAIAGRAIEWVTPLETAEASMYALEWGSAFWGILSVIPVWLIGRTLYGNRAGLWAGFLLAASPAHIQRSGFGLGDHDAFVVFWMLLGIYFLIRALQNTRTDTPVGTWTSASSLARGLGTYATSHRTGMAYAFLAGVSWAAIALSWEGFPYVSAVYAVYFGLQLFANHLRHRDSTGDILVMMIIFGVVTLAALPYYWTVGHINHTIVANTYILAGLVLISLALAFTRDLPPVLVLPSLAGIVLAVFAVLMLLLPDIGRQIFTANGYFVQNKVYSTIAEAQRTELGVFVFSVGFMTFFLGLVGFGWAVTRFFRRHERDNLFMVGWGAIGIFMAFAASRFVFNAAPPFAILGGWMADKIVTWMNLRQRVRDFRAFRQESWGKAIKSTLGAKPIAGALFLGLLLVVPNVWFSFDAGFPSEVRAEYRQNHPDNDFIDRQTGAFGQGFLAQDWLTVYGWLAEQDTVDENGNPIPCPERPAHMAWWDYGFWEVALACHPTVADNFQNGIPIAGRFLSAQSEKEAIEWQTLRLLEGDWSRTDGQFSPEAQQVLNDLDERLLPLFRNGLGEDKLERAQELLANTTSSSEEAAEFYVRVADATGTYIGYYVADQRMLPIDDPSTPQIESGSIFYAPVFLANRNPDEFVQTVYVAQGGNEYRVVVYETDADGNSRQLSSPKVMGPDGRQYFVAGNQIYRATEDGSRIDYSFAGGQGLTLQSTRLDFKAPFYSTMFYRAFVGGDGQPPAQGNYHEQMPGFGLAHWRLVQSAPSVKLHQFYLGAPLEGQVTLGDTGEAMSGVIVEAVDEFGTPHAFNETDAEGRYRLLLPFSNRNATTGEMDPITVRVRSGNAEVATREYQVTYDQAMRRTAFEGDGAFTVTAGALEVFGFLDRDRDGAYNESIDAPAEGAEFQWRGLNATTGADGQALFEGVPPGEATLSGTLEGYRFTSRSAPVTPGETNRVEAAFQPQTVTIEGLVRLEDGTGLGDVRVNVTAVNPDEDFTQSPPSAVPADADGNFTVSLVPGGRYVFTVDSTRSEDGAQVRYQGSTEVDVPLGSGPIQVVVEVQRGTA